MNLADADHGLDGCPKTMLTDDPQRQPPQTIRRRLRRSRAPAGDGSTFARIVVQERVSGADGPITPYCLRIPVWIGVRRDLDSSAADRAGRSTRTAAI